MLKKNLDEYKKAIESRDKQLSDIKKILHVAKKSYDGVVKENIELKKYIENIKQRSNRTKNDSKRNILTKKGNTLGKNNTKNIKK